MLLQQAIEEFIEYLIVELNRSAETQKGYNKDLTSLFRYLKAEKNNLEVEDLTPGKLSAYVRYLTEVKGNQPNTVRRRITTLKSFCRFLVDSEYLQKNPTEDISWPRKPQKLPRYLQEIEVEKLINIVPVNKSPSMLRDKTIITCLYYTGLRISELVNIMVKDLDLEKNTIRVTGKGNRSGVVFVHPKLKSQLLHYLKEAPKLSNCYLFCNKQGDRISPDYCHDMISKYGKKAGIALQVHPHMLRHSFATNLYRKGTPLPTLKKLLRHLIISNTAIYIHLDIKHLREGVERLNVSAKLENQIKQLEESIL